MFRDSASCSSLHFVSSDIFENISNNVKKERLQPIQDTIQVCFTSSD